MATFFFSSDFDASEAKIIIKADEFKDAEKADAAVPAKPSITPTGLRRGHFSAEISSDHADILMVLCCCISGLVDSTAYGAFGTFVSMQTGNTIFTGLGAANKDTSKPYGWAKSLTSIVCFTLGSLFFSRLCRLLGPTRRRTLILSFAIQSIIILVTAALLQSGVVDAQMHTFANDIRWIEELPIAFLSFQSAGQIVASRNLGFGEIPTVVVTSVLCDFASDPQLVTSFAANAKRNRRIFGFLALLIGALIGGFVSKATHNDISSVIWLAGGLKVLIACIWSVWPEKSVQS